MNALGAWFVGHAAYFYGDGFWENPYDSDSMDHYDWAAGWTAARNMSSGDDND